MTDTQKKRAIRIFWIIVAAPFIFLTILFIIISVGGQGLPRDHIRYMPGFEELENPQSKLASEVISADQQLLGKYYYNENRTVVEFENLPPHLVNALVATEDIRYFEHSGIDARGVLRVVFKTILMGDRKRGGGSTISQQLAKNLFPRDTTERTKLGKAMVLAFTKFKEWVIAVKLERNYTKEEILAMYLNTIPFGDLTYGIKSASKTFFGCPPDSLKIEEAALLVGVLNAPSYYHPVRNPERALKKRNNVVLYQMKRYGYITGQEYDSLVKIPLNLKYNFQSHNQGIARYFRQHLKKVLTAKEPKRENYYNYQLYKDDSLAWATQDWYGWCNKNEKPDGEPYDLYNDGLKIYTTINSRMQEYAEEAMKEHMGGYLQPLFYKMQKGRKKAPFHYKLSQKQINRSYYLAMRRSERYRVLRNADWDSAAIVKNFKTPTHMRIFAWAGEIDTVMTPMDSIKYYKFFLHSGLMSMEPQTGYIRAYVGDINYRHFKYDKVMQTRRQVGSTFKPIIYSLAMMPGGFSPCHKVANIPYSFKMPYGQKDFTPRFTSTSYDGQMVTLKTGLAHSWNQISAWTLKKYSPELAVDLARKMGIYSPIPEMPSLCVGAADIKLSEMVGAYGTFPNLGLWVEPIFITRIEDKNGNVLAKFNPQKKQVIGEATAYKMIDMMKGVVDIGTSKRLRTKYKFKNPIAGKTGTTNDNSDGWFIGYVPNLVTGVWTGGEDRGIRFAQAGYGQGASMSLPTWALYMKRVYRDKSLEISKEAFPVPEGFDLNELDCSKYHNEKIINQTYEIPEEEEY